MDFATIHGVTIAHQMRGPAGAPVVAFVNSLGTDARIWDAVVGAISSSYRVLTYDKRGHGLSDIPEGPYSLNDHIGDLTGLADVLGVDNFAVVGVSVGGLIAQGLAARHKGRVSGLILCDTAARIGTTEFWNARMAVVTKDGTAAIADQIMERWFSSNFRQHRPADLTGWRNMLIAANRKGYVATCATLRDTDLTDEVAAISVPALVVAGEHDLSTPPDLVRATSELIPDARFEIVREAGHIPSIEQPETLSRLITEFLEDIGHA
jgi:3-oxoadipate enol-lactonase